MIRRLFSIQAQKASFNLEKRPLFNITVKEVLANQHASNDIVINGWVTAKRKSKNVAFIQLNDGSTAQNLQCCVDISEDLDKLKSITVGSSITVRGKLVSSQGAGQQYELKTQDIIVDGISDSSTYPIQKKYHSLEFLREVANLRGRQRTFQAIGRVRNQLALQSHLYFQHHGFTHIHTPLITGNDCEGAGEVFQLTTKEDTPKEEEEETVDPYFFKRPVYLTVSSQLHLEMALGGFSRVYTLSPCFRADLGSEESTRHLAEFYMLEAEWAWPSSTKGTEKNGSSGVDGVMDVVEDMVRSLAATVEENCSDDIELLDMEKRTAITQQQQSKKKQSLSSSLQLLLPSEKFEILKGKYERISYSEAINLLKRHASERKVKFKRPIREWGDQLTVEHERYLCRTVGEDKRPVFVHEYPASVKPFYMKRYQSSLSDKEVAGCFDLLIPGLGECVGGSVREEEYNKLKQNIMEMGSSGEEMVMKQLDWYLELRKYGTSRHGGFGLGFDRLLMFMTGMDNIRDVVQLGRWKGTCKY